MTLVNHNALEMGYGKHNRSFSARNNIVNLGVGVGGAVRVKSCRLLIFASTKNCGLNKSKQAFDNVFLSDAQKIQLETDSQGPVIELPLCWPSRF